MNAELIHMSLGGKEYDIIVGGQNFHFEDHPCCGPVRINKRTKTPHSLQPNRFLRAASLWAQQGKRVDRLGWCIWEDNR